MLDIVNYMGFGTILETNLLLSLGGIFFYDALLKWDGPPQCGQQDFMGCSAKTKSKGERGSGGAPVFSLYPDWGLLCDQPPPQTPATMTPVRG